ncbi:MAG TPA: TIR domain-containing protein [Thiotrichaceae bacterium]|nr:TIR domain-containing protein [Thiotrichaceae bacterium]
MSEQKRYHAFISYSRPYSLDFAVKLQKNLTAQGFDIWLDLHDINAGDDFQKRIDTAIENAQRLIYIISPGAVNSEYCAKEFALAVELNKPIIPLIHSPLKDKADRALLCSHLHKHNQLNFCEDKVDFDHACEHVVVALKLESDYMAQHTRFLTRALDWQRQGKSFRYLLVGEERQQAVKWLMTEFDQSALSGPTDLHCEYISMSSQYSDNQQTQVFFDYSYQEADFVSQLTQTLRRKGIVVWTNKSIDPKNVLPSEQDYLLEMLECADNVVYVLSPYTLQSQYCQQQLDHALKLNKRVIVLKWGNTDSVPQSVQALPQIDFSRAADYQNSVTQFVEALEKDAYYHEQHKRLLVKTLKWARLKHNRNLLLRGYNLEHFEAWLKTAADRTSYPALGQQIDLIQTSRQHLPESVLDVFISYSQKDSLEFARRLNDHLQKLGKTTWFDQESIAVGVDFKAEIKRGIESSDNVLFIISPQAIRSPHCEEEVRYATDLQKRLITVLYLEVSPEELHAYPTLETIQWIDFKEEKRDYGKFLSSFNELISKLEIDREHVHQHTKWLQRALDWSGAGKSDDSLLRGSEFAIAYDWLQKAKEKKYTVHPLPENFIEESRIAGFYAKQESEAELEKRVIKRTTEITVQLSNANRTITKQQKLLGFGGSLALLIIIGVAWYGSRQQHLAEQAQASVQKQEALVQQTQKQAKDFEREVSQTQKQLMDCQQDVKKAETQTESGQQQLAQVQKGSTLKIQMQPVISEESDWEIFQDSLTDGSLGPEMVVIPAGTFRMGDIQGGGYKDEQPVHEVSVARFAMGRYEITFAEYDQFAEATARKKPSDAGWGRDDRPVINVSWNDVTAYAEWLSEQTGEQYRLPTEAEWEYAARAGTKTKYWWGDDIGSNNANCRNSYCDDSFEYTAPVGSFEANPFGLFDVSGNVWEWTCSEYEKKYSGKEQYCLNKRGLFLRTQ